MSRRRPEPEQKPYNAADPEQVAAAGQKAKNAREQELDDVRAILATEAGLRFFWRYLSECGVFRTSFTTNATIYFNEGRRDVGLRLLADLNAADPEAYLRMLALPK